MKLSFKEIIYIFFTILKEIAGNIMVPILTASLKMLFISLIIWLTIHFIPHNIEILKSVNFWGCFTAVFVVRLLLVKYEDFDETRQQEEETSEFLDSIPPAAPQLSEDRPPLSNVINVNTPDVVEVSPTVTNRRNIDTNESTRE